MRKRWSILLSSEGLWHRQMDQVELVVDRIRLYPDAAREFIDAGAGSVAGGLVIPLTSRQAAAT